MKQVLKRFRQLPPEHKKRGYVALALIAVVLGAWLSSVNTEQAPEVAAPPQITFQTNYQVHVTGAVVSPGLYELEAGARVQDAVEAAGGFADGALESSVNLARLVSDGEQILVVLESQLSTDASGYVSLNRATAEDLDSLPGVGPSTARKILDYRSQIGSFGSIEQLLEVAGIGPKLFDQIRDQLTL